MTPAWALGAFAVSFALQHGAQRAWSTPDTPPARHHLRRVLGGALYGLAPLLLAIGLGGSPAALGLGLGDPLRGLLGAGTLGLVVTPVVWFSARGAVHRARYPQIRAVAWTPRLVAANAASWAVYLTGYELAYRGLILFPLVAPLGAAGAVAVSTAVYVAAHADKDTPEVISTVPMGALFAALALGAGAVWPCALLHLYIALLGELAAVHHDPDRRFALASR